MKKKTVLVCGATGNQGGAVINALIDKNKYVIKGITRNLESEKSKRLEDKGVELVSVDFTDEEALIKCMKNVDAVFALTTPFEGGFEAEVKQGTTIANAAQKANVGHLVFNSVGGAHLNTGIPHFESKYKVEQHIKSLNIPYTIIRPAYFMENLFFPQNIENLNQGVYSMPMPGNKKLQQISVQDIGKFVEKVISDKAAAFGKEYDVSGDEISGVEVAKILSLASGRVIKYESYSTDILREQSEDIALMYDWFNNDGYVANINELKQYDFLSFRDWAYQQDWSKILKKETTTAK